MVRPFGAAPLLEQACHMGDIFAELEAKMKRLALLEREVAVDLAPA
jgi:adenylate cyclase